MEVKQPLIASVLAMTFAMALPAQAEIKTQRLAGVDYSVGHTLAQNLQPLVGKRVTVHLLSGETLTGTVKAVNEDLLHLEKLERRDFFDALIRVRDISAIETRFLKPVR